MNDNFTIRDVSEGICTVDVTIADNVFVQKIFVTGTESEIVSQVRAYASDYRDAYLGGSENPPASPLAGTTEEL